VAVEVPEPGDAEVLIRAERGDEIGGERRGGELGELAEGVAVRAPGLGRAEVGREVFEGFLELGGAGAGDALAGAGEEGGVERGGEGLLGLVELLDGGGRDEVDGAGVLDVAAALGELALERVERGAAGVDGDGDLELVADLGDLGGEGGDAELGGVAAEVVGELGAPVLLEAFPVGGEEGEGAVAVAQPPLSGGGFELEAGGLQGLEDGGVGVVLARGSVMARKCSEPSTTRLVRPLSAGRTLWPGRRGGTFGLRPLRGLGGSEGRGAPRGLRAEAICLMSAVRSGAAGADGRGGVGSADGADGVDAPATGGSARRAPTVASSSPRQGMGSKGMLIQRKTGWPRSR